MLYRITKKDTGEVLLEEDFQTEEDAIAAIKKLFPEHKPDEIMASIIEDDYTESSVPQSTINAIAEIRTETPSMKTRKTRSDAGKPHVKKEPAKTVRTRGQFFIYDPNTNSLTPGKNREELDAYLIEQRPINAVRIIQGRELKFEVQYKLKGV